MSHLAWAALWLIGKSLALRVERLLRAIVQIGFASDQFGFEHKGRLKATVTHRRHSTEDLSARRTAERGYRGITDQPASTIGRGRVERGFLISSGAIGASVRANQQLGVRAAWCRDLYPAQPARWARGKRSRGTQKEMPAFASEMHVERGGAGGRTLGYCLQAAAELGRFFERPQQEKSASAAGSKRDRTKGCRRSSKTEARSRKKREAA